MIFKKKKIKENNILTKENNFGVDVVGEDIPFNFLDERTHEISRRKFLRIYREDNNGKKYWESVHPYEIIDGNLCVRIKSDIPTMIGWIVISKEELINILSQI